MDRVPFYRCEVCGNIVGLIKNGGGTLVCCGEDMVNLVAKTNDEGNEKHVPVVKDLGDKIEVTVGSVLHPMTDDHKIEWIALVTDSETKRVRLNDQPVAIFDKVAKGTIYAYCNLHGLWKTEI